jgi:hypothetical protein
MLLHIPTKVSRLIFTALITGVSVFGGTQTISGATTVVYVGDEMATDAGLTASQIAGLRASGFQIMD